MEAAVEAGKRQKAKGKSKWSCKIMFVQKFGDANWPVLTATNRLWPVDTQLLIGNLLIVNYLEIFLGDL